MASISLSLAVTSACVTNQGGGDPVFEFDPSTLFGVGDEGAVYDFTSSDGLYQDVGLTTPVTQPGQAIYAAADLSGNGNHITANRGFARWQGMPAEWGSQLVTSPSFEDGGDWTLGTGWSVSGNIATKTAGTASSISQTIALEPGKAYLVFVNVANCTAGSVKPILSADNAGTGATITTAYDAAVSYVEVLTAASGANTIELYADAAFAGDITRVGVFEITAFYDLGAWFDTDQRLQSGNIDMSSSQELTVIIATKRGHRPGNMIVGHVAEAASGTPGTRIDTTSTLGFTVSDGTTTDATTIGETDFSGDLTRGQVWTNEIDFSQAAVADQSKFRINGIAIGNAHSAGPFNTSTTLSASTKINLGTGFNNNSFYQGWVYRMIVINRKLTATELANAEKWCGFDDHIPNLASTGDSTWEKSAPAAGVGRALGQSTPFYAGFTGSNLFLEQWGDDSEEQNVRWSALTGTTVFSSRKSVVLGVGLNDIAGQVDSGATVAQRLALLQSYINEIKTDCPDAEIIGWKLHPVLGWLEGRTNAADCIAALATWNDALTDGTVTGIDIACSQHQAQLGTIGSYMDAYVNAGVWGTNLADTVHPNDYGRLIMGVSLREALVSLGLAKPSVAVVDATPPTLSLPTDEANGSTEATLGVTTDDGTGTLYWVVSTSGTAPTAAQVQAGQDHTGSAAADSGSQAVSVSGAISGIAASGLTASTSYTAHFCHVDANSNASAVASGDGFTTSAGGDVTAPTLSSPTDVSIGPNEGLVYVTTDENNGTLYWAITTSATSPSAAQVQAGQDHTGSAATASGSRSVSVTGEQRFPVQGLSAATAYYVHFCHVDAATNASSVASGDGFTTEAAPTSTVKNLYADGTTTGQGGAVNIGTTTTGQPDPFGGSEAVSFVCLDNSGADTSTAVHTGAVSLPEAVVTMRAKVKKGAWASAYAGAAFNGKNFTAAYSSEGNADLDSPGTVYNNDWDSLSSTDLGNGWVLIEATKDFTGAADRAGNFYIYFADTTAATDQNVPAAADHELIIHDWRVTY